MRAAAILLASSASRSSFADSIALAVVPSSSYLNNKTDPVAHVANAIVHILLLFVSFLSDMATRSRRHLMVPEIWSGKSTAPARGKHYSSAEQARRLSLPCLEPGWKSPKIAAEKTLGKMSRMRNLSRRVLSCCQITTSSLEKNNVRLLFLLAGVNATGQRPIVTVITATRNINHDDTDNQLDSETALVSPLALLLPFLVKSRLLFEFLLFHQGLLTVPTDLIIHHLFRQRRRLLHAPLSLLFYIRLVRA